MLIHRDYGLPNLPPNELRKSLVILSSYSGNTEETLSAFEAAFAKKLDMIVISGGGKLLGLAIKRKVPHIKLPAIKVQPRSLVGASLLALAKAVRDDNLLEELNQLNRILGPSLFRKDAKKIANELNGLIPVIYSSSKNFPLAYFWKTNFNETDKIPAFCNRFPELNHNEMEGFNVQLAARDLVRRIGVVILWDKSDSARIAKRVLVFSKLLKEKGVKIFHIELRGRDLKEKIFNSIMLAQWVSVFLAESYGSPTDKVELIEKFKKMI